MHRYDAARYKNSLEEELRKKWRMSEAELRQEALEAMTGEARAAMDEREEFHAHRQRIQNDVEIVARGAAAVEAHSLRLAAERAVADDLAEAHARRAAEVRAKMDIVAAANKELEEKLARSEAEAMAAAAEAVEARERLSNAAGGVAASTAAATVTVGGDGDGDDDGDDGELVVEDDGFVQEVVEGFRAIAEGDEDEEEAWEGIGGSDIGSSGARTSSVRSTSAGRTSSCPAATRPMSARPASSASRPISATPRWGCTN